MSASGDEHLNYWERCGQELDVAVNVLLGGSLGMTVSMRAALAAERGERWGVWLCTVLSWTIQPGHCTATLSTAPSPWFVYARAGAAFALLIAAVAGVMFSLVRVVLAVI